MTFHMNDHVNQRRRRRPSCYCLVVIKSVTGNRLSEAFGKLHFLVGLSPISESTKSAQLRIAPVNSSLKAACSKSPTINFS